MRCSVLTQDQVRRIHEVSLDILDRVGVELPHPEALRRFADSGARVDFEKSRVWIPPDLVGRSIDQAGKQFTIYGRDISPGHRAAANFYKCGDETAVPHYGAWSPIDTPQPDFHRPEFFGEVVFG